jgi:anti-sigma regulatory factor (Ser/Thr protein kinase)
VTAAPHSTGYIHHALFYDSTDALLATAVPFLRAGLNAGEPAILVCRHGPNSALTDALGADPDVTVFDRAAVYTRTAHAVANYRQMMRRHTPAGTRRVRLVGEVAFGADPKTWPEWMQFEAIVNAALSPYPLSSVCAYDTRSLPDPVLASAEHTHPLLLTPSGGRPSPHYRPPAAFLRQFAGVDPDPLETTAATYTLDLTGLIQLADLRHQLRTAQALSSLPTSSRSNLVAAVAEIAANGLIHGRPPVRVRLWVTPTRVLCAVTDQGPGFDDPLAGYAPADTGHPLRAGAGLWLARQSCDRLDMTTAPDGFTVRLSVTVPPDGADRRHGIQARAEAAQRRAYIARARADELQRRHDEIETQLLARLRRQRYRRSTAGRGDAARDHRRSEATPPSDSP